MAPGENSRHQRQGSASNQKADRLRALAREKTDARFDAIEKSKAAYASNERERAKQLSNQAKKLLSEARELNQQASKLIFDELNAEGRIEKDCIDLHGQFVDEVEDILMQRINKDIADGKPHLHAIVGKGNHSTGHVPKIKPRVEELCRENGLPYRIEENEGRILIDLKVKRPSAHKPHQPKPPRPHVPPASQQPQQQEGFVPTLIRQIEPVRTWGPGCRGVKPKDNLANKNQNTHVKFWIHSDLIGLCSHMRARAPHDPRTKARRYRGSQLPLYAVGEELMLAIGFWQSPTGTGTMRLWGGKRCCWGEKEPIPLRSTATAMVKKESDWLWRPQACMDHVFPALNGERRPDWFWQPQAF